jgi:hypothetical protein
VLYIKVASFIMRLDGSWEQRSHVNTAHTVAWADQNSDVSLLAPIIAPRVLNNPILLLGIVVSAVTNQKNSMIKVGWASCVIIDNATVIAEPS